MNSKILSLFILGLVLILSSCGDGDGPVVSITSPADGTTVSVGSSLEISGTVTDDVEVTSLKVESATSALQLSGNIDLSTVVDKTSFPFRAAINIDTMLVAGEYDIDVIATDNDGNEGSDRLTFNIQ